MSTLAPFGFQAGQSRRSVNEYYVPASDTSAYAVGDPVKTNGNVFVGRLPDSRQSNGMLHVGKAAPGNAVRGVVVGVVAGPGDNSAQSVPAVKQRAYTLLVNDNPQALWDVQANNTAALSAMGGMYASYTVGGPLGSVSSTVVDASSIGTDVGDLLIAEVLTNTGANSLLRVAFVQHEMAAAGGSPQIGASIQSLVSEYGIPPAIAIMGDSIAQQNTLVTASSYYTQARGPVMWMLSYLGHPWDFQPADNFAVGGTTLDQVLLQLPGLLAAHASRRYQRVFMSAGTNDTSSARPIAEIQADFLTLFRTLRGAGIIPVHTGIRPRGIDVANTAAKQANMRLNEWLYGLALSGQIEFVPVSEVYADTTTAFGNAVAALMYDGGTSALHPNARGAALEGKAMADYYSARGIKPGLVTATQQADQFDRTNNPGGVAFASANPLLIGGTTTPTGMTTSGGTWSNVGRTLANGQTRADRSCALAASATHYLYDDWTKTGPWLSTELQPGDIIEGRALVVLTGVVNVNAVQMRLAENNGSAALTHYALANSETANLQGDHVLYLRTPRVPVRDYAGSGNVSIFARADIVTDAGASGTAIVRAMEVRKVG